MVESEHKQAKRDKHLIGRTRDNTVRMGIVKSRACLLISGGHKFNVVRQITRRGAAVLTSPLLGVPVGSISSRCASPTARGRCATPLGTMNI